PGAAVKAAQPHPLKRSGDGAVFVLVDAGGCAAAGLLEIAAHAADIR
ncbi:MAG: hypothetical protein K0Q90_1639, partial [Paenibacillaceae bacterium]|nr:hypothetical protein [Paenibacillaceae bacterium]